MLARMLSKKKPRKNIILSLRTAKTELGTGRRAPRSFGLGHGRLERDPALVIAQIKGHETYLETSSKIFKIGAVIPEIFNFYRLILNPPRRLKAR